MMLVMRSGSFPGAFWPRCCGERRALAAGAGDYPNRPIRMIVPQAPGSASDTVARIIAAELTTHLKQQIVVDNRPGGALLLGLELTAKAPPDGYTIGYGMIGALAISPNVVAKPPLDVQKDLAPIVADDDRPDAARGRACHALQERARPDRVREAEPGQAQLRLLRQRHARSRRLRAVQGR